MGVSEKDIVTGTIAIIKEFPVFSLNSLGVLCTGGSMSHKQVAWFVENWTRVTLEGFQR